MALGKLGRVQPVGGLGVKADSGASNHQILPHQFAKQGKGDAQVGGRLLAITLGPQKFGQGCAGDGFLLAGEVEEESLGRAGLPPCYQLCVIAPNGSFS